MTMNYGHWKMKELFHIKLKLFQLLSTCNDCKVTHASTVVLRHKVTIEVSLKQA